MMRSRLSTCGRAVAAQASQSALVATLAQPATLVPLRALSSKKASTTSTTTTSSQQQHSHQSSSSTGSASSRSMLQKLAAAGLFGSGLVLLGVQTAQAAAADPIAQAAAVVVPPPPAATASTQPTIAPLVPPPPAAAAGSATPAAAPLLPAEAAPAAAAPLPALSAAASKKKKTTSKPKSEALPQPGSLNAIQRRPSPFDMHPINGLDFRLAHSPLPYHNPEDIREKSFTIHHHVAMEPGSVESQSGPSGAYDITAQVHFDQPTGLKLEAKGGSQATEADVEYHVNKNIRLKAHYTAAGHINIFKPELEYKGSNWTADVCYVSMPDVLQLQFAQSIYAKPFLIAGTELGYGPNNGRIGMSYFGKYRSHATEDPVGADSAYLSYTPQVLLESHYTKKVIDGVHLATSLSYKYQDQSPTYAFGVEYEHKFNVPTMGGGTIAVPLFTVKSMFDSQSSVTSQIVIPWPSSLGHGQLRLSGDICTAQQEERYVFGIGFELNQ